MFDVGFWELALIGVVALLVIGPERLPSVARSVGQWVAKARNFVNYMQADFKEEINKTEELKRLLTEQSKIKEIHEIIEQSVTDARSGISVKAPLAKHEVKSFERDNSFANSNDSSVDSSVDSSIDSPADKLSENLSKSPAKAGTGSQKE